MYRIGHLEYFILLALGTMHLDIEHLPGHDLPRSVRGSTRFAVAIKQHAELFYLVFCTCLINFANRKIPSLISASECQAQQSRMPLPKPLAALSTLP